MTSYHRILPNPKNKNAETAAVHLEYGYTLRDDDGSVWVVGSMFDDGETHLSMPPVDAVGVWFKAWLRVDESDWSVVSRHVILRKNRWSDWSPPGGRTAPGLDCWGE